MSQDQILSDSERRPKNQSSPIGTIPRQAVLTVAPLSLFTVQPVTAQSNVIYSTDNPPSMTGGFFRFTTALGIVGLATVWQANLPIEMFTPNPEQKKGLRRYKRSAMKSTVVLAILGLLYTVTGTIMGLPLAEFVNLIPW